MMTLLIEVSKLLLLQTEKENGLRENLIQKSKKKAWMSKI